MKKKGLFWKVALFLLCQVVLAAVYWDYSYWDISPLNNAFENVSASVCEGRKAQDVHIVYITDKNYVYPTQVSMYSAIKNKCPQTTYHFYILTDGVDTKTVLKAFRPMKSDTVYINIIPQKRVLDLKFAKQLAHISPTALLKFVIPEALPAVDRVIYFDSDTVIMKDLQDLYNTDLENKVAAAVADIATLDDKVYLKTLGYREKIYFNSGMLVLDLKKMRKKGMTQLLNKYARSARLNYIDQDAYNVVLRRQIKTLPYIYNCMSALHLDSWRSNRLVSYIADKFFRSSIKASAFMRMYTKQVPFLARDIFKEVVVFHYFGDAKPWNSSGRFAKSQKYLFFKLWEQYAQEMKEEYGLKKKKVVYFDSDMLENSFKE